MDFISKKLNDYIKNHSTKESDLLKELSRETKLKILNPRMLSGSYQGRILSIISKLTKPKYILEIGTYTGYSSLCLVEGMKNDGELHTIGKGTYVIGVFRINRDGSITAIANIIEGERINSPKEAQHTYKKIK